MPKSKNKKEKIIKKAAQLFIKSSYESTSMKDIAESVGIQAPGIYHYFKSKKEILLEITEESWRNFRKNIIDELEKIDDPEEKIKTYISKMIRYQFSIKEIATMAEDPVSIKYIKRRKIYEREVFYLLRDILCKLAEIKDLQDTIDPTLAAFSLYSMIARINKWYNPKGRISIDELVNQITSLFFHGFYRSEVIKRKG